MSDDYLTSNEYALLAAELDVTEHVVLSQLALGRMLRNAAWVALAAAAVTVAYVTGRRGWL